MPISVTPSASSVSASPGVWTRSTLTALIIVDDRSSKLICAFERARRKPDLAIVRRDLPVRYAFRRVPSTAGMELDVGNLGVTLDADLHGLAGCALLRARLDRRFVAGIVKLFGDLVGIFANQRLRILHNGVDKAPGDHLP